MANTDLTFVHAASGAELDVELMISMMADRLSRRSSTTSSFPH